ncbi:MAG: SufS family cysteine desulfurase [Gammaproteobacteria bacterium]|nr:SufS family cysteine desulfurase [Gammaproteobacteria bacterium]
MTAQATKSTDLSARQILSTRADFPCLNQTINDQPLAYLDSAASSQVPQTVIDAMSNYMAHDHANVHRSVHQLAARATEHYENARQSAASFINAQANEIVLTSGTTESINLIAHSFGTTLNAGDEIIITAMEHHANIVPWQQLCQRTGAIIKIWPINNNGDLQMDAWDDLVSEKTKLLSMVHISNALGTVNSIEDIIKQAKAKNIAVLIDGAQAVAHRDVDVKQFDCDFYVFSGHKMYGPTGIGVLYAKQSWLNKLPPYQTGGEMIRTVSFEQSTFAEPPHKFEAGTPNISAAVGLTAAIDYLNGYDLKVVRQNELNLLDYAVEQLQKIDGLQLIGMPGERSGAISFVINGVHPHDIGTICDHHGVAIRTGHHCAMPLMKFYEVPATARLSVGIYTHKTDIDQLIFALQGVKDLGL